MARSRNKAALFALSEQCAPVARPEKPRARVTATPKGREVVTQVGKGASGLPAITALQTRVASPYAKARAGRSKWSSVSIRDTRTPSFAVRPMPVRALKAHVPSGALYWHREYRRPDGQRSAFRPANHTI